MKKEKEDKLVTALGKQEVQASAFKADSGNAQQHTLEWYVSELSDSVLKLSACVRKANEKLKADCRCGGLTSAGCPACRMRQAFLELLEGEQ